LDTTNMAVRGGALGRVASRAVAVESGIIAEGAYEGRGVEIAADKDETFWTRFLRSVTDRGRLGVRLSSPTPTSASRPQVRSASRAGLAAVPGACRPQPPCPGPERRPGESGRPADLRPECTRPVRSPATTRSPTPSQSVSQRPPSCLPTRRVADGKAERLAVRAVPGPRGGWCLVGCSGG